MTKDQFLTISQMSEVFHVTPRTLRFYESRGLLAPVRSGQHRLYGRRERGRMKLIVRGRRFGFSLDEISSLLALYEPASGNLEQLTVAATRGRDRLAEMRAELDELTELIASLEVQIEETDKAIERLASAKQFQRDKDEP